MFNRQVFMLKCMNIPCSPKIDTFARIGFVARATVYFLMGALALLLAFRRGGGAATDSKGALRHLLQHDFGTVFLGALAAGLFSYAIWRTYEAWHGTNTEGGTLKGIGTRAGYVLGAVTHASLGLYALSLIFLFSSPSGRSEQKMAEQTLSLPFGQLVTALIGLGIFAFGISQFFIAYKERFARVMVIPARHRNLIMHICKFGLVARGIVFAIIGGFFVQAAVYSNSRDAGGIVKAWGLLREQAYGNVLLGVVAAGFIAFGIYGIVEALYEHCPTGTSGGRSGGRSLERLKQYL